MNNQHSSHRLIEVIKFIYMIGIGQDSLGIITPFEGQTISKIK
jgi:hypothetical protein